MIILHLMLCVAVLGMVACSGDIPPFFLRKLDRTDTLTGIDADNNGIRDDIELFIAELNITDKQKSALRFKAYSLQGALLVDLTDKFAVASIFAELSRARVCFSVSFPNTDEQPDYSKILTGSILNTRMREERYVQFNMQYNRVPTWEWGPELPAEEACESH